MIFIRDPNLKSVTQTLKEFKDKKSKTKEMDQLIKSYGIGAQIIKSLKIKDLADKNLLSDEVGTEASIISKEKSIRKMVHSFQINFAYNPPKNFKGSCLDGYYLQYCSRC